MLRLWEGPDAVRGWGMTASIYVDRQMTGRRPALAPQRMAPWPHATEDPIKRHVAGIEARLAAVERLLIEQLNTSPRRLTGRPRIVSDTRRCSACRKIKPLTEFGRDASRPSGYTWLCHLCQSDRDHRRYVARAKGEA